MEKLLLFIDALAGNPENTHYDTHLVQQLIVRRLELPLELVQRLWTAIDLSQVQEADKRSLEARRGHELPSVAEVLAPLISEAARRFHLAPIDLECVVVLPAIGHIAVIQRV